MLKKLLPRLAAAFGLAPHVLGVAAIFSAAWGQVPPPVPALPDVERRTQYSISVSQCGCAVGFALFGSGTDVDSWIEVWIGGVRYPSTDPAHGWVLSSATGTLGTIPRPITNAVLVFNQSQTGVVQIVGAERPRRLSQFQNNQPVSARDHNQVLTDLYAIERELWDKTNDVTGRTLLVTPGQVGTVIPGGTAGQNKFIGTDGAGNFALFGNTATSQGPAGVNGVLSNARLAKVANYGVLNADKGSTFALGGNAFFSLTFPTPTGFDANFAVLVVNEDTWSGGRAKYVAFPGGVPTNRYLYPGQSMLVYLQNGVWFNTWTRVKLPGGPLTINCNGASGSDIDGVADGLATGAGAFLSVQHAIYFMDQNFEFSAQPATLVTLLMGANDPGGVHYSPHGGQGGAAGGAAIKIDGGGHVMTTGVGGGTAIQTYFGSVIQVRNMTILSDGGWAIEADWGSKVFVLDGMTFGTPTVTALGHLHALNGSKIEVDNNYTVAGDVSQGHVLAASGAIVNLGTVVTFSNSFASSTSWIQAQYTAQVYAAGSTWTLGGNTVSGLKFTVLGNGVITGSAGLPGTGNSTGSGGQAL